LLVEDVVKGQQTLVLFEQDAAGIHEDCGVDSGLAGLNFGGKGYADQNRSGQVAGGGAQFVDSGAAAGQKAGFLKEVGGRIATDNEFGEDGEARTERGGATADGKDFLDVSGEIPDGGIDLGQCNLHTSSLIHKAKGPPRCETAHEGGFFNPRVICRRQA